MQEVADWPRLGLGAALASAFAVGAVRRIAIRRSIMDVPNERSSHSRLVPRGGGLGVVVVFIPLAALIAARAGAVGMIWVCLAAACAVAWVGWLDDRNSLSVSARLIVHVGSGMALAVLTISSGERWWWAPLWFFWAVSCINVINFMDGIDALVASQCAILFASLAILSPPNTLAHKFAILLCGTTLGFLLWNRPPALIFLGDTGSGTLGFLCALVGALLVIETDASAVRAFLPLFPLFLDATWTVWRRVRNGERVTQAHRTHLYQRLANGGWGHAAVSTVYAGAALVGAAIALLPDTPQWPLVVVGYAASTLALGALLDRAKPFPWRSNGADSQAL